MRAGQHQLLFWFRFVFFMTALFSAHGMRADHYVAQNGQMPDAGALYSSWETAASNIQDAVNVALSGSNIWVAPGTYYALPGSNNVIWIAKSLALRVSDAPGTVTVDGGGAQRGVYARLRDPDLRVVIDGFTITNCVGQGAGIYLDHTNVLSGDFELLNCVISNNNSGAGSVLAGGIYVGGNTNGGSFGVLISNCVVSGNTASYNGGGAWIGRSYNVRIINSQFDDNTAAGLISQGSGGGCYFYNTATNMMTVHFQGCRLKNNVAKENGGGVYLPNATIAIVMNDCLFESNHVGLHGGAINLTGYCYLTNCAFKNNYTTSTPTDSFGAAMRMETATREVRIYNSLFTGNTGYVGAICTGNNATGHYSFVNCTIVSNFASGSRSGGLYVHGADAVVEIWNTILYHNKKGAGSTEDNRGFSSDNNKKFYYSCTTPALSAALDGGNNTTADPLLIDIVNLDFYLSSQSPCINTGTNQVWMEGAVNVDGQSRLDRFSRIVDMGCFEYIRRGMMFTIY